MLCASCRAYLATYQITVRVVKTLDEPNEDAPEGLIRAILEIGRRS